MEYNRRRFIKTMFLGLSALSLPSLPSFGNNSSESKDNKANNSVNAKKKEAMDCFYRREYDKAVSIYKDLISENSSDITIYDGLAKVYAKQYKNSEVASLFQAGLEKNKENPIFYDRLSRSLMKLSLGNVKQEEAYINSTGDRFLIQTSLLLYLEAIDLAPDKRYLREGLLDGINSLEKKNKQLTGRKLTTLELDQQTKQRVEEKVQAYRTDWQKHRQSRKQSYKELDDQAILKVISDAESKTRRKLYFDDEQQGRYNEIQKHKKKCYSALLISSIAKKQTDLVDEYYSTIKQLDKTDTFSKGKIVRYYNKTKDYDKLIKLYQSESINSSSLWAEVRLAQISLLKGNNPENELKTINDTLIDQNIYSSKILGATAASLARCGFDREQFGHGRSELLSGMKTLVAGGVVNSLIIEYAESYFKEHKFEEATIILKSLAGSSMDSLKDEELKPIIKEVRKYQSEKKQSANSQKQRTIRQVKASADEAPLIEDLKALYSLAKMYERLNDNESLLEILSKIRSIDSKDKFLEKRI